METIGKIVTAIIILIVSAVISGFVLMKIWGWFIVTSVSMSVGGIVIMVNPLSLSQAVGLSMFFAIFTYKKTKDANQDFGDLIILFFERLITLAALFFVAWITYIIIY